MGTSLSAIYTAAAGLALRMIPAVPQYYAVDDIIPSIGRFGEYEERPYVVDAMAESGGVFRLRARPLNHQGAPLSTKPFKASGLTKTMRALHLPEVQIASVKADLERSAGKIEIGGSGPSIQRVFNIQDLVAAGFEEANTE